MPTGSCTLINMSAKLSSTAKYKRISMIVVLRVNCLAGASLVRIALSQMTPTEPQKIVEDA